MKDQQIQPIELSALVAIRLKDAGLPAILFCAVSTWPAFDSALDALLEYCDRRGIHVEM